MRARIVDNLLDAIELALGDNQGHRSDAEFLELCERIQGKEVNLVFTCGDAFEEIDNSWWLPESCWTAIEGASE
jgi:hypothetical protein